jgi:hypothetical protein
MSLGPPNTAKHSPWAALQQGFFSFTSPKIVRPTLQLQNGVEINQLIPNGIPKWHRICFEGTKFF